VRAALLLAAYNSCSRLCLCLSSSHTVPQLRAGNRPEKASTPAKKDEVCGHASPPSLPSTPSLARLLREYVGACSLIFSFQCAATHTSYCTRNTRNTAPNQVKTQPAGDKAKTAPATGSEFASPLLPHWPLGCRSAFVCTRQLLFGIVPQWLVCLDVQRLT
jgi:hypothetical protein